MIRAIIVEDEAVAARRLQKILGQLNVKVVKIIHTNKELSEYIQDGVDTDLFFMDINLSDGIVFEVLQTTKLTTPIIFTTAYDEYAIKAFKQNSIDYLLKPINKEELNTAIEKFRSMHREPAGLNADTIAALLNRSTSNYRERFKVRIGDRLKSFKVSEIVLFYSSDKTTYLAVDTGRSYPIDNSIDSIYSELDPSIFHRVNRGQIVNIDAITDVISYSNSRLKVVIPQAKDQEIIVARDRVNQFKDWFG